MSATSLDRTLQIIQMTYPQVYLACHTRHQRKRTSAHRLSARDSAILSHLNTRSPVTPARLAAHLSVGRSTVSEALKRLTALGYVQQVPRPSAGGARGGSGILLTPKGMAAIQDTSVLEADRLRAVLALLTPAERLAVERGLGILADACRRMTARSRSPEEAAS